MKKLFLAIVGIIFILHTAAQDKVSSSNTSFSLGAELSLPVGTFGDIYSFGFGASGQGNFAIADDAAITLYAGYINYSLKSTYGSGSAGYLPVLGGVEFGFSPQIYASAQLGLTFYTKGGGSAFTYAPGIGFKISNNISALLKYTAQSKGGATSGAVGARLAYIF
jgi:hypothetical protein